MRERKGFAKTVLGGVLLASLAIVACDSSPESGTTSKAMEERMRDIEKRMKDSLPKTQELALKQNAAPEVVKKAQEKLTVLKEYLDPPSGKIDMVTVNAIQAFQKSAGLHEDGMLNEETLKKLDEAATKAAAAPAKG